MWTRLCALVTSTVLEHRFTLGSSQWPCVSSSCNFTAHCGRHLSGLYPLLVVKHYALLQECSSQDSGQRRNAPGRRGGRSTPEVITSIICVGCFEHRRQRRCCPSDICSNAPALQGVAALRFCHGTIRRLPKYSYRRPPILLRALKSAQPIRPRPVTHQNHVVPCIPNRVHIAAARVIGRKRDLPHDPMKALKRRDRELSTVMRIAQQDGMLSECHTEYVAAE